MRGDLREKEMNGSEGAKKKKKKTDCFLPEKPGHNLGFNIL